jgi:hypothetical protein
VAQVNPHCTPSQVAVPCAGATQGVQELPQLPTAPFGRQVPLQSWLPPGQSPAHDIVCGAQAVPHSRLPLGQVAPQLTPSQVAAAPVGTKQGLQL